MENIIRPRSFPTPVRPSSTTLIRFWPFLRDCERWFLSGRHVSSGITSSRMSSSIRLLLCKQPMLQLSRHSRVSTPHQLLRQVLRRRRRRLSHFLRQRLRLLQQAPKLHHLVLPRRLRRLCRTTSLRTVVKASPRRLQLRLRTHLHNKLPRKASLLLQRIQDPLATPLLRPRSNPSLNHSLSLLKEATVFPQIRHQCSNSQRKLRLLRSWTQQHQLTLKVAQRPIPSTHHPSPSHPSPTPRQPPTPLSQHLKTTTRHLHNWPAQTLPQSHQPPQSQPQEAQSSSPPILPPLQQKPLSQRLSSRSLVAKLSPQPPSPMALVASSLPELPPSPPDSSLHSRMERC